ncbi:MAG: UDP-N-acetylmuramate:L-alanyl-gamma-D-glutamyl-meso-diaminopimelate ligase [Betaproteobacteria bacterium]|nr:UDP-N-acetylmuramate:L-alanyl-gamma-D-glutamyl-meso-diaminopimelate ligase [Betaproteobacteria bacterium]
MHLHILGICGTFMGGIALLARASGHRVTGCDANVYPPMSNQLADQGIELVEGWDASQLALKPDVFVIGNVVTRGNPLMEAILDRGLPYISGPQWLRENILIGNWVIAVAGTHGKTTVAAMLAWILEQAGHAPGFLIGGIPSNFGVSARLAPLSRTLPGGRKEPGSILNPQSSIPGRAAAAGRDTEFFVVEADEYDTAFFDKRSKFLHYPARTAILNNLEFDHADIFPDLAAIETQFHHFVRTLPLNGLIVANGADEALARVLARGCYTPLERVGVPDGWSAAEKDSAGGFDVLWQGKKAGRVAWSLAGVHNRLNALAAIAAARHAGVAPQAAVTALGSFAGVKRRMEVRGVANRITVYDDFAHHPTAIENTLAGLRAMVNRSGRPQTDPPNANAAAAGASSASGVASMPEGTEPAPPAGGRILAVLEPRSNTMKAGVMKERLAASLAGADRIFCYSAGLKWDAAGVLRSVGEGVVVTDDLDALVEAVAAAARPGDHVLVMSNGGFGGVHAKLLARLAASSVNSEQ